MQRSCITGTLSLRHLKTEFFRLKMDFKKKGSHMSDKALSDWVFPFKYGFKKKKKKKKKRESDMAHKALPQ